MLSSKVDILAFAAHPDDVELAASGTIMKHIAQGKTVAIVDLTQGEMGSRGTIHTRYEEAEAASEILGLQHRVNLKMEDGFFEINEENKRKIVEQIRRFQPDIVLANAMSDRHPDHGRGGKLVSEACFLSGLVKVETELDGLKQEAYRPKAVYHYIQDYYIKPDFVVDVTDFIDRKMASIQAYKTQFFNPDSEEPETPISSRGFLDFVEARMREFGRPIGAKYAEGFTVERFIGVEDLFDLK
ncbi:MAG: bacillithiol biosynthesis deacetylase BshB1 [Crocinitomicaceae bacterium]|nr:bacillithiol biosynthesis deacetylase BshB1 [Crocinitomicaceae bacterium]